jgi:hypothetical protein
MKRNQLLLAGTLGTVLAASPAWGQAFVRNPSFESNYNDVWPHYSAADEWVGASGVNDATGPFHNNGTAVPDRDRIGFKQGGGDLTQDISGLTPGGVYWLQFFYDGRAGGGASESLIVKWNDTEIGRVADLRPATGAYYFMSAPFVPEADAGTIRFTHVVSGDRTLLLDGVTVVARGTNDIVLKNPSFEASGKLPAVGPLPGIGGWVVTGTAGVDDGTAGQATSGTIPDQELVAYLEGPGSLAQTVDGLIVGNDYELRVAVNAKSGTSPRLQLKVGDAVVKDQTVASGSYQVVSAAFKATASETVLSIGQSKDGGDVLLIDDVRLLGTAKKPLPPMVFSPLAGEVAPGQTVTYSLSVPAEALASGPVAIKLTSSNPNVARLAGAVDGVLTLTFSPVAGSVEPVVQSFTLETLNRGAAAINVTDAAKIPFSSSPSVNVVASLVRNASFESNPAGAFPGYGTILGWSGTGQVGLNRTDAPANPAGPFGDNGLVPDREQVAFIQGNGSLSQDVSGLVSGRRYWLQFRYNARNCCGDRTQKLTVKFGGKVLAEYADLKPVADAGEVNYYAANLPFTAEATAGLLEFVAETTGDASTVLDAVNIVARAADEIVIQNPSFEASGSPPGVGYVQPYAMSGWEGSSGGRGINVDGEGPFTDNGDVPDQDRAGMLQNVGYVSQVVTGLTPGQKYTLVVSLNARNCCGAQPIAKVSVNDNPLMEEQLAPVGGRNPYHVRYLGFTADTTDATIRIDLAAAEPAGGDASMMFDDVHLVPGTRTAPVITAQPVGVAVNGGESIVLDGDATGQSLTYEWRRNGVALKDGGRVSGATTKRLTITGAVAADAGNYTYTVSDGLGVVGSEVALVEVAAVEQPKLMVSLSGGTLSITSEPQPLPEGFVLQVAPTVSGPWVDQPGVNTPTTTPLGNEPARFLRAVKP